MYSGIFNNPFMIWGAYRRRWFKITLTVSFQFHHTQMDDAHAARFLNVLQRKSLPFSYCIEVVECPFDETAKQRHKALAEFCQRILYFRRYLGIQLS